MLLAQTGPFSIAVKCLRRKCLLSVDQEALVFKTVCIGETVCQRVTVSNTGAIPTAFHVTSLSGKPQVHNHRPFPLLCLCYAL